MASYQPQMPPSASRKPMPMWAKVLLGLGALVIVGILGIAGVTYYFVQKIASEPGGVRGAALRIANPDYEIISIDEKTRTLVVRHKKTGKEGPIGFDRLRNGAINPSDIGLSNEEAGVMAMPEWLIYPGSTEVSKAGGEQNVQVTLETEDDGEKVFAHYQDKLQANQYRVSSVSLTKTLSGTSLNGKGSVTVQMLPGGDSGKTRVLVVVK